MAFRDRLILKGSHPGVLVGIGLGEGLELECAGSAGKLNREYELGGLSR